MQLQQRAFGSSDGLSRLIRDPVPGLAEAREQITKLITRIEVETGLPKSKMVLGGFSQGGILATDTALHLEEPLAGLCILSGKGSKCHGGLL
eukprot:m.59990 g.59990  ORF g.59990 m.59990 type:complete len:92 (+) comp13833_c0_seq1:696-971(+)